MRFSETRNYGINEIIKQYTRFPWYLPLPAHLEHGWTPLQEALKSDLQTNKPLMLVYSKRRAQAWKKQSSTPVAVMGSPFIHYKNMHQITKQADAKGTVVFPSHSTYKVLSQFSIEEYCKELKNLPREFQPITICLFWLDFINKKADIYRKFGFDVVSAGHKFSIGQDFVKNFYCILRAHKYATSNEVGSYTFCAIDLGLPFFLTGKAPLIHNTGNDINLGKTSKTKRALHGSIASDLFSIGPIDKISAKQKDFVRFEMGTEECLSGNQLRNLLIEHSKSHRSFDLIIRYLLESVFLRFALNGPWGKLLVVLRNSRARTR